MSRFFAFGCSYTHYLYPTWADLYGAEFDEYYNLAQIGAGNQCIFEKLVEADITYQFKPDDTIIIMWSTCHRHDLYKDNKWVTPGHIFSAAQVYDEEYIRNYFDIKGSILHTFNYIYAAKKLLEQTDSKWSMGSMASMTSAINEKLHQYGILFKYLEKLTKVKTIFTEFPELQKYEFLFESDWLSLDAITNSKKYYDYADFCMLSYSGEYCDLERDHHPSPKMHLGWLVRNNIITNTEKQEQIIQEWSQQFPNNIIEDTERSEIWVADNMRRLT